MYGKKELFSDNDLRPWIFPTRGRKSEWNKEDWPPHKVKIIIEPL